MKAKDNVAVNMLQQRARLSLDQSLANVLALPNLWICFEEDDITIGSGYEWCKSEKYTNTFICLSKL